MQIIFFAILANVCSYAVGHLVRKVEQGGLQHHHEGDPLVEGGLGSLFWSPIFLLNNALEVALVGGGDVGAAVDPAVVLRQV